MEAAPPSKCMNTSCASRHINGGADAQFALRIDYAFSKKGFPPKATTAWFGLYLCSGCATQQLADTFAPTVNANVRQLGISVANSLRADHLDLKATKVYWGPRHGADQDFKRFEAVKAQEAQQRAASLASSPEAANEPNAIEDKPV